MKHIPNNITAHILDTFNKHEIYLPPDIQKIILQKVDKTCCVPFHKKSIQAELRRLEHMDMCNNQFPHPYGRIQHALYHDEYEVIFKSYWSPDSDVFVRIPVIYPDGILRICHLHCEKKFVRMIKSKCKVR